MKLELKGRRRLLVVGALCLIAVGIFIFYQAKRSPKVVETRPAQKEETLYTKAQIDALIKDQLSRKSSEGAKSKPMDVKPPDKRKLNTPIAAFVKKSETEKKSFGSASAKSKALGIPTGTKIKAHLANTIFSFNVTSPVVAVTDEALIKEGQIVIPKGTQFIGDAAVQKSLDRINVRFQTMVLPGGKEIKVEAMALSLDGSGGIKGKVDKQTDKSLLKAVGETAVAGGAMLFGTRNQSLTLGDELRLNAAQNLSDDARNALNQVKIEESITVQSYTPIQVLFLEPN